jgi:hypothetical protein
MEKFMVGCRKLSSVELSPFFLARTILEDRNIAFLSSSIPALPMVCCGGHSFPQEERDFDPLTGITHKRYGTENHPVFGNWDTGGSAGSSPDKLCPNTPAS